jgi:hypothetical protein
MKKLSKIVCRLANEFLKFKIVKIIKNIHFYTKYPKSKVCEFRPCVYNKTVIPLTLYQLIFDSSLNIHAFEKSAR